MNEVRIGIVGISNMGLQHARYIVNGEIEGARLTAVCATRASTVEAAKKELPKDVAGFTDYDAFLHSGLIDADGHIKDVKVLDEGCGTPHHCLNIPKGCRLWAWGQCCRAEAGRIRCGL